MGRVGAVLPLGFAAVQSHLSVHALHTNHASRNLQGHPPPDALPLFRALPVHRAARAAATDRGPGGPEAGAGEQASRAINQPAAPSA